MQPRLVSIDENKESSYAQIKIAPQSSRAIPRRFVQLFALFLASCVLLSIVSFCAIKWFRVPGVIMNIKSGFQPGGDECSVLSSLIRPPSNLLHQMNDEELFWRASFLPRIKRYPFHRVPKIAFLFLTKGPLPLEHLWQRFFKGHEHLYSIYMHSLPSFHASFPPSSIFYKRLVPSQVSQWGKMSICDAERRLVANALLDISNEWFVLLSESCIPLYNFTTIYHYISKSKHSFVGAFDDQGPLGRGRYSKYMVPEVNITQWRKGSQWFEINRGLAVSLVEDVTYSMKFREYCKPSCYPDEHYIPTMLTILAGHLIANRTLTWVDWSRGGAHPATFGRADIKEELFRRISGGRNCSYNGRPSTMCFLFARKFLPGSLDPLLHVAAPVLGF